MTMIMTLRLAVVVLIVTLFIQHTEGFQSEYIHDDSFNDNVDDTRATYDGNDSGNNNIHKM